MQTGHWFFDFYCNYFGWLINWMCPYKWMGVENMNGFTENPFLCLFRVILMIPFIAVAGFIPIFFMVKVCWWVLSVWTDHIEK